MKKRKKKPMAEPMPLMSHYKPTASIDSRGKAPKVAVGDRHSMMLHGTVKAVRQNEDGTHTVTLENHKVKHRTVKKVDNT